MYIYGLVEVERGITQNAECFTFERKIVNIFLQITVNICFVCSLRRFLLVPTPYVWVRNKNISFFLVRTLN